MANNREKLLPERKTTILFSRMQSIIFGGLRTLVSFSVLTSHHHFIEAIIIQLKSYTCILWRVSGYICTYALIHGMIRRYFYTVHNVGKWSYLESACSSAWSADLASQLAIQSACCRICPASYVMATCTDTVLLLLLCCCCCCCLLSTDARCMRPSKAGMR